MKNAIKRRVMPVGDKGEAMAISPSSRAKFEKLGLQYVRKDIGMGFSLTDGQERVEAQEWMHEQQTKLERRETFRYWSMLVFTLIAAVAACIAAEPIVKVWIWPPH